MQPLFVIPNAGDLKERVPGNYAITLRDGAGTVLARYPFTPEQVDGGPALAGDPGRAVTGLLINELVPYVAGTNRVDIEGPGGAVIGDRQRRRQSARGYAHCPQRRRGAGRIDDHRHLDRQRPGRRSPDLHVAV